MEAKIGTTVFFEYDGSEYEREIEDRFIECLRKYTLRDIGTQATIISHKVGMLFLAHMPKTTFLLYGITF